MTPLEKDIEKKLRQKVEALGGFCLKWDCPGWSGVPDRIVLLPGARLHFVELKRPKGGRLSKLQEKWHEWLGLRDFDVWTIWNERDLDAFFCHIQAEADEDPHRPLTRRPHETEEAFIERVAQKITDNKLTLNAVRKSFGLPPIEKE